MIAVDTNILIYAHREDSPFHNQALRVITDLAEGRGSWAIAWSCIHEFLAVVTHPGIFSPPTPLEKAISQVDAWLESPGLVLLSESADYWDVANQLLATSKVSGRKIHDARIAAICMDNGVTELLAADRDFGRFPGLKTRNPLIQ